MQSPFSPASEPTPMNAPLASSDEFAPMPLRTRGVLEQLDLAIKVYRRYFAPLSSWAALVMGACTIIGLLGLVSMGPSMLRASVIAQSTPSAILAPMMGIMSLFALAGIVGFFGYPLIIGAVACSITAAVRGQRIEFEQCWEFIKPRYGGMLLQIFLGGLVATLIGFVAMIGLGIVFTLVLGVGGLIANSLGGAGVILGILAIIAVIAFYIALLVIGSGFYMWFMMIPIVAAMEDNRRSGGAIGRAWELMKGGWKRAGGLMILATLGLSLISWLFQFLIMALMGGLTSSTATTAQSAVGFLSSMITSTFSIPFSILVVALFYLDQRVRNEALDLEWSSYAGAEPSAASPNYAAPTSNTPSFGTANGDSYAPTPRAYSSDTDVFDVSNEDLATMSLDSFMPKKPRAPDEIARAQEKAIQSFGLPVIPDATIQTSSAPIATDDSSPHQTQILTSGDETAPAFALDATSSTRSANNAFDNDAAPQSATKTCAQCGAQVGATQNFCLSCGARL